MIQISVISEHWYYSRNDWNEKRAGRSKSDREFVWRMSWRRAFGIPRNPPYQTTISVQESVISPSSGCSLARLPFFLSLSLSRFSLAREASFTGYLPDGNFPPVALITAISVRLTIIINWYPIDDGPRRRAAVPTFFFFPSLKSNGVIRLGCSRSAS